MIEINNFHLYSIISFAFNENHFVIRKLTSRFTFFFNSKQLQSAQPLLFASRQQEQQQQATTQSQLEQQQQQSQENNLLGVAFSPSDQVSHVKFSNGEGLKYNF